MLLDMFGRIYRVTQSRDKAMNNYRGLTPMFIIQLRYGYEGYRQFALPRAQAISRGAAEGNKHGRGVMDTACIPK